MSSISRCIKCLKVQQATPGASSSFKYIKKCTKHHGTYQPSLETSSLKRKNKVIHKIQSKYISSTVIYQNHQNTIILKNGCNLSKFEKYNQKINKNKTKIPNIQTTILFVNDLNVNTIVKCKMLLFNYKTIAHSPLYQVNQNEKRKRKRKPSFTYNNAKTSAYTFN